MGLISGSIPPSFVLSHYMPMVNTTSNWLCFGAFLSPPVSSLGIHWPLTTDHCSRATGHCSRATRHSPLPPKTIPRWLLPDTDRPAGYCLTPTAELTKPNGTRSRRAGPLSHYAPNQAIPAEKSIRFFPTRRRPTVDRSLVAWRRSTPAALGVPAGRLWVAMRIPSLLGHARPWKGARCMISCVAKNRRFLVWTMGSTSCTLA